MKPVTNLFLLTVLAVPAVARATSEARTPRPIPIQSSVKVDAEPAIVTPAPLAPYLSKFAVGIVSRGEGVGRDLWRAMHADFPRLFWRSRADNPITSWYRENCDGMARFQLAGETWWALWRGLAPIEIPLAIEYCQASPPDFG